MKKQPREYSVELERYGVLYSGTYTIENGLITVTYEFIPKTTQLGNQVLAHKALAIVLLGEILDGIAARKVPTMEP